MNNSVGENIRMHRDLKGFSQEYMAQELGINQSSYAKIEKETTKLTVERLQRIAEVLDVEVSSLLSSSKQNIFNQTNEKESYGSVYGYIENLHIENKEITEKLLQSKDNLIKKLEEQITYMQKLSQK